MSEFRRLRASRSPGRPPAPPSPRTTRRVPSAHPRHRPALLPAESRGVGAPGAAGAPRGHRGPRTQPPPQRAPGGAAALRPCTAAPPADPGAVQPSRYSAAHPSTPVCLAAIKPWGAPEAFAEPMGVGSIKHASNSPSVNLAPQTSLLHQPP